ncbi:DNA polymerase/3'-5' exonuclease PolX [bacterium]|nr:MAG: DNA polymerase/3'-5' exonuclease PolX [bacterium]
MENAEIARIFYEIADLLEVNGENPFRVRSYRNAADVIDGMPESLKTLAQKGEDGLKGIHGIGDSIREKIFELLATGKCGLLEEILKQMPVGILDILRVSGIGPKKAGALYSALGIATLEDLAEAASSGKLRLLDGFGEKTEAKILRSIKSLKAMSGVFKLSLARPYALTLTEYLGKVHGVTACEAAGSVRRWKETAGDIDILAACDNAEVVMERFTTHPDVKDVIAKGAAKSSVMLRVGIQADLRVVDEKCYGAALLYFTGSKAHNVALRDMAKRKGLKINEYGVFSVKGEKWLAGKTEEDVYKAMGLAWIPPELRENKGELIVAQSKKTFRLLEIADLRGDLHCHTSESDGSYSIEDMAFAAMSRGYEYLAITDHSKAVGVAHGLNEERVVAQMERIDAVNAKLKKRGKNFTILKGAEVDIRADGTLDHPDGVLDRLDLAVGAVHSSFNMDIKEMTARIVRAIKSGKIDVLAHPTGRLIGAREPYAVDMEIVMDAAKKHGVALELNSYPDRLDLNDVHCNLAKHKGVMVALSTDSHSVYNFENIIYGVHTARRGWLEKADILNTMPLSALLRHIRARRGL